MQIQGPRHRISPDFAGLWMQHKSPKQGWTKCFVFRGEGKQEISLANSLLNFFWSMASTRCQLSTSIIRNATPRLKHLRMHKVAGAQVQKQIHPSLSPTVLRWHLIADSRNQLPNRYPHRVHKMYRHGSIAYRSRDETRDDGRMIERQPSYQTCMGTTVLSVYRFSAPTRRFAYWSARESLSDA